MTRKQAGWALLVGAVGAVALLLTHRLILPVNASWTLNRVLHHAWQATAGLAAAAGILWALRPRPKPRRRDLQRELIRRRGIAVIIMAMAAVCLVIAGELLRDHQAKRCLLAARPALQAIYRQAQAYRADHDGRWPESLESLKMPASSLYYPYRDGPSATDPEAPSDGSPSYAVAGPIESGNARRESRILAYLRPGQAWAPLTMTVDKVGHIQIVGEDRVSHFERNQKQPGPGGG